MKKIVMAGLVTVVTLSGCTVSSGIPGVPDVELTVPEEPAAEACRGFASAFATGTTREEIFIGLSGALESANAMANSDPTSAAVANGIQAVMAAPDRPSLEVATASVIEACRDANVSITLTD